MSLTHDERRRNEVDFVKFKNFSFVNQPTNRRREDFFFSKTFYAHLRKNTSDGRTSFEWRWRAIVPSSLLLSRCNSRLLTQRALLPYNYQLWQVCREICHGVFVGCARSIGVCNSRDSLDEFR